MTSTTSTKRLKPEISMLKLGIKNNLTVIIIYLSLILFFGIIYFMGSLSAQTLADAVESDFNPWVDASIAMASMTTFLSFLFMIVLSVKEFSYLHNKRKTDMFGALPITRRSLFITKSLTVFLISAVPMTVVMLLLMLITANEGSPTVMGMFQKDVNVGDVLLRTLVNLSANIAFIGFLSVCCGKTSEKVLSYLIINGAYPIGMMLVQLLPASFLYGYTINFDEMFTFALCPACAGFAISQLYWLGFTAVFFAASVLLVRKRKAESAQSHFAYTVPKIVIKLMISFAVGIAMAFLFAVLFNDTSLEIFRFWLGMIIGSFLSYFVVQLIFAGGFAKFGKSLIPYGIMIAAFAAVFVVISMGFFGYNSYIPSVDSIKSVSFTEGYSIKHNDKNIIEHNITDKKEIEKVTKLHKDVYELVSKDSKYSIRSNTLSSVFASILGYGNTDYYSNYMGYNFDDTTQPVSLTYTLNNGSKVSRKYGFVNVSKLNETDRDTFYRGASPLFICEAKDLTEVEIFEPGYFDDDDDEFYYDGDYFDTAARKQELISTIKEDYEKYGLPHPFSGYEIDLRYGGGGDASYDLDTVNTEIYIPQDYKKTLALIEKCKTKYEDE